MGPPKIALIFGIGARVGVEVARAFAAKGYKVAGVSRSGLLEGVEHEYELVSADLSKLGSVEQAFAQVKERLGLPSVVIYNASAGRFPSTSALERPVSELIEDTHTNVFSAYQAAQLAVESFAQLPPELSKTFIYTGNKQSSLVIPPLLTSGIGKAGAAHLVHYLSEELKGKGYKFYFADQRLPDGKAVYGAIDGPAHGAFYTHLAEKEAQGPWNATFVKGKGYVDFGETKASEEGVDLVLISKKSS